MIIYKNGYNYDVICHTQGEYVAGEISHTNTVEAFWSMTKTGTVGAYLKVSRKYQPLYVENSSSGATTARI